MNININGKKVTGTDAELHFLNWALALEQEFNEDLETACSGDRCALEAIRIFQDGVFRTDSPRHCECRALVEASGISIH